MIANPGKVIDELRAKGWSVVVTHARPIQGMENNPPVDRRTLDRKNRHKRMWRAASGLKGSVPLRFAAKGGQTLVVLDDPDGVRGAGRAKVHPLDNFDKRIGLGIALERALEDRRQNKLSSDFIRAIDRTVTIGLPIITDPGVQAGTFRVVSTPRPLEFKPLAKPSDIGLPPAPRYIP